MSENKFKILIYFLLLFITLNLIIINLTVIDSVDAAGACDLFPTNFKGNEKDCDKLSSEGNGGFSKTFLNIPIVSGAYCYNDGTGRCKAFAGKFEFYFNSFTSEILGPAEKNTNFFNEIDEFGYHTRVPVSYNLDGDIVYADQTINWARKFANATGNRKLNLLSVNSFDWCRYVDKGSEGEGGLWPYKSAMWDYKSNKRYQIFFFNRQTCIIDTLKQKRQIYNTRFLQNSSVRIDLDMNPLIFSMEDNITKDIRVVKHKRQHWYESKYYVKEIENQANLKYYIEFDKQTLPCKIDGNGGHIFTRKTYRKFSDICVDDRFLIRGEDDGLNNPLLQADCGTEATEISDYPYPYYKSQHKGQIVRVSVHNIPRYPKNNELYFGITVDTDKEWKIFAADGYTFTAATSIPLDDNSTSKVRLIQLYSEYKAGNVKPNIYDEYYPQPYLSDFIATIDVNNWNRRAHGELEDCENCWNIKERESNRKALVNLNYVDDIAYLHKCKTILIIFGPLYSELPADKFNLETTAPIDSIYELGIWEMVNSFFAEPDSNTIWVYHRLNYMTDIKYNCAKNSDSLVTATRSGVYKANYGVNHPSFIREPYNYNSIGDWSEEKFFKLLNIYKGQLNKIGAPDPNLYYRETTPPLAQEASDNTLIYIIIGVAILLILAMLIISLITLRRRRKRRHSGEFNKTNRSGLASQHEPSKRSILSSLFGGSTVQPAHTARSSFVGSIKHGSSTSNGVSKRSNLTNASQRTHGGSSTSPTVRSPSLSRRASSRSPSSASSLAKTRRTGISKASQSAGSSKSSSRTKRSSRFSPSSRGSAN